MNPAEDLLALRGADSHVDGNAVAGAMSLVLGREATTIVLECAGCGNRHRVAETRVYLRCPGMVVRCPACSACEAVLVDRPHGRLQLTLMSVRTLELP
ncbi:DUF6510 family protein [Streptomyces sp. JJ36]|uniref:DUF6510 family protein n=1 Tax=Streptomyces sp. JJ36 TaxID=2736645 RepID=UPI001F4837DA|nr:DUF6510 family protein [Streptomyces sp. JJ36]MCF6523145.1 hypothetical protein [Streptomyces sp. JJ36]